MKSALTVIAIVLLAAPAAILAGGHNQRPVPLSSQRQAAADKEQQDKQQAIEPQAGDQTIRLGTELVDVLFSVVDPNNHIVSDIKGDEVRVLEDGRPQQVFTFRREVNLPINIAVLMDVSGSQEYTFPQEKMAAGYFLHSIIRTGKDSAALLTFQDDVDLVQGLTSSLETISRALDEIDYTQRMGPLTSRNQATALYDALYITVDEVLGREDIRTSPDDPIVRRAIILLTDGADNA
ncbi:MAG TPA: VWA domain-containing protein, partial [Blastocatellia bacterium]|nr:VWA domain-containing protein [Blastocatellia bacterium]